MSNNKKAVGSEPTAATKKQGGVIVTPIVPHLNRLVEHATAMVNKATRAGDSALAAKHADILASLITARSQQR